LSLVTGHFPFRRVIVPSLPEVSDHRRNTPIYFLISLARRILGEGGYFLFLYEHRRNS